MIVQSNVKYDVVVTIDEDYKRFTSLLKQVIGEKDRGEISGTITRENNKRLFVIDNSEMDENLRNNNLGFLFYTTTITKCLDLGCTEFQSSAILNDNSKGVWNKIHNNYYNCKMVHVGKKGGVYYVVTRKKSCL